MLENLRNRMAHEESGFTLIELLVVMLILGILAAIAVPSFLGQRDKATDAEAKAAARTAQTAAETYFTDNGNFTAMTNTELQTIEPTLEGFTLTVTPGTDTYTVEVDSDTGNSFSVVRATNGTTTRTCDDSGNPNAGCNGGTW